MKKILGLFITLVLSTVAFSAMAQTEQNDQTQTTATNALRNFAEKNAYGDNWFVSLGGNANLLVGEQDSYLSLTKRLGLGGGLTVGKWFNPYFGARIQVMGGALKGFNRVGKYVDEDGHNINNGFLYSEYGYYFVNKLPNVHDHWSYPIGGPFYDANGNPNPAYSYITAGGWKGFKQDFNYGTATFDFMANLTNLFRGHDSGHNPVDVIGIAGLGAIHAFNNKVTTPSFWSVVAKVGARINFNITEKWAIYLEGQANMTDKEFDGYAGTPPFGIDGIVNAGLGVQYTFNKRYTTLTEFARLTADEIDLLNKKINDNRYLIDNHQDILERQQALLDKLQKCCDEKPKQVVTQVVDNSGCLPQYVRFSLDSYKIEPSEQPKIAEVVDFLKKNPISKIYMVGYADRKTGNPRYNLKLSQKRIEAVTSELKKGGINANRILSDWKGDKEQPFPPNDWNRVVVMVERK